MKTVKEISKITGVSVRTLHHYDAIGLLKPTAKTPAGYRLYDDTALERLQQILLFRELQFPLKEIQSILDSPSFNPVQALEQQIHLLELQYKRLGNLLSLAREIQQKGVTAMDFQIFDNSELEQYKAEAREKWGSTREYQEYEQKEKAGLHSDLASRQFMQLFAEAGALRQQDPSSAAVQEKIHAIRVFITDHYYTCSPEILEQLGEMYVEDERFRTNIDRAGGEGTAAFVRQAIRIYCKNRREKAIE